MMHTFTCILNEVNIFLTFTEQSMYTVKPLYIKNGSKVSNHWFQCSLVVLREWLNTGVV